MDHMSGCRRTMQSLERKSLLAVGNTVPSSGMCILIDHSLRFRTVVQPAGTSEVFDLAACWRQFAASPCAFAPVSSSGTSAASSLVATCGCPSFHGVQQRRRGLAGVALAVTQRDESAVRQVQLHPMQQPRFEAGRYHGG